jgi:pantoate--beta-alanine ligase
MKILETPRAMQQLAEEWRCAGHRIGFVPTMGALHEGHLSLLRRARTECDRVVASIFVNPLQFGAGEDLEKYPRPRERDDALLQENGCDALFAPAPAAMYEDGAPLTTVRVGALGERWEGAARPGHFDGVATVVAKLFNIARAHRAYFGEKDYQQLKIIERMARDLNFETQIVPCPTMREADGLALSSRNAYLSAKERHAAATLYRALQAGVLLAHNGEREAFLIEREMQDVLDGEPLLETDYLAVVDADTLEPLPRLDSRAARVLLAARVGPTRLIDNVGIGSRFEVRGTR